MTALGIIGGSGLSQLDGLKVDHEELVDTPFADNAVLLLRGRLGDQDVVFLPRHGSRHSISPHKINYRANLWAIHSLNVEQVIGMAAVGGIAESLAPGTLCVADQIIDYTYGREHTYFAENLESVTHVDFTEPYCEVLRQKLISAGQGEGIQLVSMGTYAATQGPRLESAAEIHRLKQDGCDLVGMTGMPEAGLARELGLCYANLSLVVNWAAGLGDGPITMSEIERHLETGMQKAIRVMSAVS